ncbi:MAG: DEAD/DEAH box helicase [Verrucomicrobia bacterium]|nr:DEAD/DEAH box helicase [Verrucomicrobiota bacterium]MDA1066125.1 DEAD/DEAH box helicase [Verrucomicrobiota bacterium]
MKELNFEGMPLAAPIQKALAEKGYTTPSPIQAKAIPVLLQGRDLLACAQTGTGKTAAFALPILHGLAGERRKLRRYEVRNLILTPTRELAVQVAESFSTYGNRISFEIGLVYGGVSQVPQVRSLKRGLDVLVATTGRLLDLIEQGYIELGGVECFVLDEADRMLDMGFIRDIRKIGELLPRKRQTLLFSATMAPEITKLASTLLHNPEEIRITPLVTTAEKIDQYIHFVEQKDKLTHLLDMMSRRMKDNAGELNLVFSRTKHGARKLAEKLERHGVRADAIHGDKSQAARQKTLDRFKNGQTPVLVATDVAARGIDVRNITLVVNYDLPSEADNYVHRIGRTARAGASGRAITFCCHEELDLLRDVEKIIKQSIPVDSDHVRHSSSIAARHNDGARSRLRASGRSGGNRNGNRNGGSPNRTNKPKVSLQTAKVAAAAPSGRNRRNRRRASAGQRG